MEEQEEYVTDALEMIGVVQPKQIETNISGFVPVFDYVANYYKDNITALVFGRRWQYCGMEDGVCRASLSKIAGDLHLDEATVMRHTEKLVKDGFLIDKTPNRRNRPHVYIDGGRVTMKTAFNAHIAQSNTSIAQSNVGIAQSQLIKQDNTILNKPNVFSNSKPAIKGIEASIYEGRPTTQEDIDPAKVEYLALIAFETSFGVNTEKGQLLHWYARKPEWTKLRRFVTELYQNDPQCFDKYKVWRKTPYVSGAVSLKGVQSNPLSFMASWVAFTEATQPQDKQEETRIPKVTIVK